MKMCMLCGNTKEQGKREALHLADSLERLAIHERNLASGRTDPHGDDSKKGALLARQVIRCLVQDYL
jgi:hypothetical protein